MDGVISGLTSIVPIMPEQTTITDRSGVNGPPVEIMPLPSNSFMSEDAQAELLNNPFTLSLDIKGYSNGEGGKAVGRTAAQAGITAQAEDAAAGALLNNAYTLSLGNDENAPIAAEIVREMSRMKNYELLGKNPTRRLYRMNPDTGAAESVRVPSQDNETNDLVSEKVRSLFSQSAVQQDGDAETILPQGVTLTPQEYLTEEAAVPPPAAQTGRTKATGVRQDMSLLASLAAGQLSASDIEAILTLEPDLQEALLNMLSSVNTGGTRQMTMEPNLLASGSADESAGVNTQSGQNAPLENDAISIDRNMFINAQPGSIRQTLGDIARPLNASEIKLMTDVQDNTRAAPLTDEELVRLTADALTGGKVLSALSQSTLRGSMQNLQKVNELPYSLYIFGNIPPNGKGDFEEEGDIAVQEETGAGTKKPAEFLRISEAIKMASVLHNIYYGGSGRFPQETPWYAPYIGYAIRNGIIKENEFGDYNEPATRAETAYIFSGSVPRAELPMINSVSGIPDVSETVGYGERIYLLYRAGILAKTDKKDSFHPERTITRTEAAIIIGRIATPADRKLF